MFLLIHHVFALIFCAGLVASIAYDEMEPVIQVGWDEESVGEEDFRKEAVKYVKENYKEIEKKMKGHQKGITLKT